MRFVIGVVSGILLAFAVAEAQTPLRDLGFRTSRTGRERIEFPLRLKEKIVAGKTIVGSPVTGTLVMATLIKGVVIPEGAAFSGVVEQSEKRADNKPSRLRIHISLARWSDKTLAVDLYATGHVYPPYKARPDPLDMRQRETLYRHGIASEDDQLSPTAPKYDSRQLLDKSVRNERSTTGEVVVISAKSNIEMSGGGVYCFEGAAAD